MIVSRLEIKIDDKATQSWSLGSDILYWMQSKVIHITFVSKIIEIVKYQQH